jgi:sulfide dehydrogenase cytochrome subunit
MRLKHMLVFGMFTALHVSASAVEPGTLGERYASTCASCHGTNGVPLGEVVPGLAGKSKDEIVNTMKEFKAGKRQATIMHQIAKGYSEQQIELLATYFAAQKK